MHPIYKILISLVVLLFAGGAYFYREAIGMAAPPALLAGLAAVMVIGLWMFPEPRKEKRPKR